MKCKNCTILLYLAFEFSNCNPPNYQSPCSPESNFFKAYTFYNATSQNKQNFCGLKISSITSSDSLPPNPNSPVSSSSKDITTYSIPSLGVTGIINGTSISLASNAVTSFTPLIANFTTTGTSVSVSGTPQVSGTTSNNYSSNLSYLVTAVDGSTKTYTVTFTAPRTFGGGASLRIWLRADSLGFVDNATVTSWTDGSGNNHDFSQPGANKPIFRTNQINGLPILRFTGGKSMDLTGGTSLRINDSGSFFVVLKINVSTNTQSIFNVGGANNRQFDLTHPTLLLNPGRNGVGSWITSSISIPISIHLAIGSVQILMTSSNEFWNGDLKGTQTTGILGYAGGTTAYVSNGLLDADIAELMFFNTALSQNEIDKIFCYLRAKYNLTSTNTSCGT